MATFDSGHAFVVGIANYPNLPRLPITILKDATDISALLSDRAYCGYPLDHLRHLSDEQATAAQIRSGLYWLAKKTGQDDTVIIFFSGHGGRIIAHGPHAGTYLMPFDADPANLKETAIKGTEFIHLLQNIRAGRLLLLVDCYHAGGAGDIKVLLEQTIPGYQSGWDEDYYNQLVSKQEHVIIASARPNEQSWTVPGIRNSLFVHYLLEALRGQARVYDDGLIRVLDVFNFVAEEVPKRKPQQPILKAGLKTNFPIACHQGRKQGQRPDPTQPSIENPQQLPLPAEAKAVLKTMFAGYQRVVVKKEFDLERKGSRVFLTRPIKNNNVFELPILVKMAPVNRIEREWQAYQACIRDRLPHSFGLRGQPVLPAGYWGGLRYPMAGENAAAIEDLRRYCRHASLGDVRFVVAERLLRICEQLMQFHRLSLAFPLQASFDPVLPVNLVIQPALAPQTAKPHILTPETLPNQTLRKGDYVCLDGFIASQLDLLADTVTLNLPASSARPPASYRVRLKSVANLSSYQVNRIVGPVKGVILKTRQDCLAAKAQRILGSGFNPAAPTLTGPEGARLPNPLTKLAGILSQQPNVKVGRIHGSLALENILVNPSTREISLIDFAAAREDYLLHDFLRLETEIVTKLIPEILAENKLEAGAIVAFYRQLHEVVVRGHQPLPHKLACPALQTPFMMLIAIRRVAGKYLFDPDGWGEYYQGLVIYLLGALKLKRLEAMPQAPLPKQVAFWGAAIAADLIDWFKCPATPPGRASQRNGAKDGRLTVA